MSRRPSFWRPERLLRDEPIVLSCYLLAVCQLSVNDRESGALSIFNLIEAAFVAPYPPAGTALSIQLHAYFELEEADLGVTFDTRVAWVRRDNGEEWTSEAPPPQVVANERRVRVRSMNLMIPPRPGAYRLHMLARRANSGEEWRRVSPMSWPLELQDMPPAGVTPA